MKHALISPFEDVIRNGIRAGARVAQVEAAPFEVAPPLFWVEVPDDTIADEVMWDGGDVVPAPDHTVATPPPLTITRRQCAIELFMRQMITDDDMVAMTQTGAPPPMVEAIFVQLPQPDQNLARTDFAAGSYQRNNPLLTGLMTAAITAQTPGATEAQISAAIDDFFRMAGAR
jgi:hypothetical protein